eukprot:10541310-Lingulodinium_polyedra.AAC.1
MRQASPPIRLSAAAAGPGARESAMTNCEEVRLARPQIGHDRYWVVWSQGEIAPERVEAQLAKRLRGVVRARDTAAYRPSAARDEEAVLARAPPAYGPVLARAASDGLVV